MGLPQALQNSLIKQIAANEPYEAYQSLQSYFRRQKYPLGADQLPSWHVAAKQFAEARQFDLVISIGLDLIKTAADKMEDSTYIPLSILLSYVEKIAELCPPNCSVQKLNLYSNAIALASTSIKRTEALLETEGCKNPEEMTKSVRELKELQDSLRMAAASTAVSEEKFGLAQRLLVLCNNSESCLLLATLLPDWIKMCYPSESHLLILRIVLILLSLGKVEGAAEFFDAIDFADCGLDGPDASALPPAGIQLAYFLIEASKAKKYEFFSTVLRKYALVIRRDPSFSRYIDFVSTKVFGKKCSRNGINVLEKLSSMLG